MTAESLSLASSGASSFSEAQAARDQGEIAKDIARVRAEADERNAEAVEEASIEQAKAFSERGRRFLKTQKSTAAAGNVRINVGSPNLIAAETTAALAKDKGFILKGGSAQGRAFRASARNERRTGKAINRRAKLKALAIGIRGASNIAFMGSQIPGKKDTPESSSTVTTL